MCLPYQPCFALSRLLVKNNVFSGQNNFFLSTHCWPGLILLFWLHVVFITFLQFCHGETAKQQSLICMAFHLVSYQIM